MRPEPILRGVQILFDHLGVLSLEVEKLAHGDVLDGRVLRRHPAEYVLEPDADLLIVAMMLHGMVRRAGRRRCRRRGPNLFGRQLVHLLEHLQVDVDVPEDDRLRLRVSSRNAGSVLVNVVAHQLAYLVQYGLYHPKGFILGGRPPTDLLDAEEHEVVVQAQEDERNIDVGVPRVEALGELDQALDDQVVELGHGVRRQRLGRGRTKQVQEGGERVILVRSIQHFGYQHVDGTHEGRSLLEAEEAVLVHQAAQEERDGRSERSLRDGHRQIFDSKSLEQGIQGELAPPRRGALDNLAPFGHLPRCVSKDGFELGAHGQHKLIGCGGEHCHHSSGGGRSVLGRHHHDVRTNVLGGVDRLGEVCRVHELDVPLPALLEFALVIRWLLHRRYLTVNGFTRRRLELDWHRRVDACRAVGIRTVARVDRNRDWRRHA